MKKLLTLTLILASTIQLSWGSCTDAYMDAVENETVKAERFTGHAKHVVQISALLGLFAGSALVGTVNNDELRPYFASALAASWGLTLASGLVWTFSHGAETLKWSMYMRVLAVASGLSLGSMSFPDWTVTDAVQELSSKVGRRVYGHSAKNILSLTTVLNYFEEGFANNVFCQSGELMNLSQIATYIADEITADALNEL